jgi:SAM-dependent methyltransferase
MTAYDEIIYPGRPYPQSHPAHLAAVATLFGMSPTPVDCCRVLEVACGDAANLIPMALGLSGSEFVGFDLARRPIEAGKGLAAQLSLRNLSLDVLDLREFPADTQPFDYIIAHGLYSWVPGPIRDQLLSLIAKHLAPQGVAFVTYNVYPGCYIRRILWEMLRFHTEHLEDPAQRAEEAKTLMR